MSEQKAGTIRGYLYVAVGCGFGVYRGLNVEVWEQWDYIDQLLALGMIVAGLYILLKK